MPNERQNDRLDSQKKWIGEEKKGDREKLKAYPARLPVISTNSAAITSNSAALGGIPGLQRVIVKMVIVGKRRGR